jgi:hypothetical protein
MKPNNFFKFALGCLLTMISTNVCSRSINYLLFHSDRTIYDEYDTMVEEKGYIFSASSIETNVLTTGSLSQFEQKLDPRGLKDMSEIWRFKQIEPHWYLYYRHFFRAH